MERKMRYSFYASYTDSARRLCPCHPERSRWSSRGSRLRSNHRISRRHHLPARRSARSGESRWMEFDEIAWYMDRSPSSRPCHPSLRGRSEARSFAPPPGAPAPTGSAQDDGRSEEHTSELQSRENLVCRLLLENKK